MPVAGVPGREGPFDTRPGHAILDHRIIRDVITIVIIYEAAMADRQINQQGGKCQQQTYDARTGLRRAGVLALESRTGAFRAGFRVFAILALATQAGHRQTLYLILAKRQEFIQTPGQAKGVDEAGDLPGALPGGYWFCGVSDGVLADWNDSRQGWWFL